VVPLLAGAESKLEAVELEWKDRTDDEHSQLNVHTIGRGSACDIQVLDKRVSSSHCKIYCEVASPAKVGGRGGSSSELFAVFIEDHSSNGTWVNKTTRLRRGQRRQLHSGDEVSLLATKLADSRIGGFTFVYDHASAERRATLAQGGAAAAVFGGGRGRVSHGGQSTGAAAPDDGGVWGGGGDADNASQGDAAAAAGGAHRDDAANNPSQDEAPLRRCLTTSLRIRDDLEAHYQIKDQIGTGANAVVYRGIQKRTGQVVAIKKQDLKQYQFVSDGQSQVDALVMEATVQRGLDHPGVVKLIEIYKGPANLFFVQEMVSGGDLFDRLVAKRRYREADAKKLMRNFFGCLDYIHSKGVVHRDLKPENIMMVSRHDDTEIKIADFGLATDTTQKRMRTYCGTPQYLAPEVLKRQNTVQHKGAYGATIDCWSAGVIMFTLLCGAMPFQESNLDRSIQNCEYNFDLPIWTKVSSDAKALIRGLIAPVHSRLDAKSALKHPWFNVSAGENMAPPPPKRPVPAAAASGAGGGGASGKRRKV
jgi:tRNA A-37 threonylcarbamoyl transferase component Bud32